MTLFLTAPIPAGLSREPNRVFNCPLSLPLSLSRILFLSSIWNGVKAELFHHLAPQPAIVEWRMDLR